MNERNLGRRALLKGVAMTGAAAAVATVLPAGTASARTYPSGVRQVPGIGTVIDTSHATPGVSRVLSAYFQAKTGKQPEATMAQIDRAQMNYLDAVTGEIWPSWQALHDLFAKNMPKWPADGKSYATRIVGDDRGAIVYFSNTPGLFAPGEIRATGVVNLRAGKITRWVDYWDGRHVGIDYVRGEREPFPADFKENTVGDTAAPAMQRAITRLAGALATGASTQPLFAEDAVFEDLPAHLHLVGPAAITRFLTAAHDLLPYTGPGTTIRHTLGGPQGGGYEWTSRGPVPHGVTALELDPRGLITRATTTWDGSFTDDATLAALAQKAVEH
ncbi:hypothetical protein VSH64_00895 [Amycolatopsis rhabdoformis]|uniref:Nuclear transport factor 2 family protein n=1 Tax=Amycolatopsis rhabdoformis TaxID=1448059 RepID=A0ABZ1I8J4_9PSEU|nr:hypothetical protein [Amycolatopsis rhabdoformis]WSE30702.1 hypothetical protein VSH64_00895 [Amycolatopsis rhabdoformis]